METIHTSRDIVASLEESIGISNVNWDCFNSCFFNYDENFITITFCTDSIIVSFNEFSSHKTKCKKTWSTFNATFEQKVCFLHRFLTSAACLIRKEIKK